MRARTRLRLRLPPLSSLHADSVLPFAVVDRQARILRTGELPLRELAAAIPAGAATQAVLHPGDAVVAQVTPPPVADRLLSATVHALVESMALSGTDKLCIAHGARQADGAVPVAWAQRTVLAQAWRLLADHGLHIEALVPQSLISRAEGHASPLETTEALWTAQWPTWSLALPEIRPDQRALDWRPALRWAAIAAVIWIGGLLAYAHTLRSQVAALEDNLRTQLQQAFPDQPAGPDPLAQARAQRDALRLARGQATGDDLMPLALGVAQSLPELAGKVTRLQYQDGTLSLLLQDTMRQPPDMAETRQALAARGLILEIEPGSPATWRLSQGQDTSDRGRP